MKRVMSKINRKFKSVGMMMLTAFFMSGSHLVQAQASISGSKLATGTEKLIKDATSWLMILAPVAAGLLIIYFCIRRSAADEMDTKKWNNRIMAAIVSCIGAVVGSAMLNVIIGYYK